MTKRICSVAITVALSFASTMLGIGHASNPGHAGDITGSGTFSCNATIVFPHSKTDAPTNCDGALAGVVSGLASDGSNVAKAVTGTGNLADKSKQNFNAVVCYHPTLDPITGLPYLAEANGTFESIGTDATKNGTGYVRGSFEYTQVVAVAVVTIRSTKANCGVVKKTRDLRVGGPGSKGSPDSGNQIYCKSNPAGTGVFLFTPKSVPARDVPFVAQITGTWVIDCF